MNRALPMNSMRFISGDTDGMKRLSISPVRNAPKMPSSPQISASAALKNSTDNTYIYNSTPSAYRRKNHRVSLGMNITDTTHYTATLRTKNIQTQKSVSPLFAPTMAARISSDIVSAIIDDPTLSATLLCFCRP